MNLLKPCAVPIFMEMDEDETGLTLIFCCRKMQGHTGAHRVRFPPQLLYPSFEEQLRRFRAGHDPLLRGSFSEQTAL